MFDSLPGSDARRHDRALAVLLGLTTCILLIFFHRGFFHGTDEISVFETTRSIYERGSLETPPATHVYRGVDGTLYSHFAVGQSVLALPLYAAGSLAEKALPASWTTALAGAEIRKGSTQWGGTIQHFFVGLYSPIVTGLLVGLFFLVERRLNVSLRAAVFTAALLGSTTYVASLGVYFLRHTTEALLVLAAFACFIDFRSRGQLRSLAWGSLWASSILLIRVPGLMATPALIGYLAWVLVRSKRNGWSSVLSPRAVAAIGLPFVGVVAIHAGVNHAKWGTLFSSPMLDQSTGFTTPLYVGLFGFLLSPGASIFVYSPLLVLVFWTIRRFWATHRAECATVLGVSVTTLLICSKFEIWSGLWSAPGPRYMFVATPLLMLALGPWLDHGGGRSRWVVCSLLGLVGAAVQFGLLAARFGTVRFMLQWDQFVPPMSFLFIPDKSPIVGSWLLLLQRPAPTSWIVAIGTGWTGQPPHPTAAWMLGFGWAVALASTVALLIVVLRRHPEFAR